MKNAITCAMSMLFITFVSIIMVNVMSFQMQVAKVNDYHYGIVNEIETSDFSATAINSAVNNGKYTVSVTPRSTKEDLRIYQVTTKTTVRMPVFGFTQTYVKESTAR